MPLAAAAPSLANSWRPSRRQLLAAAAGATGCLTLSPMINSAFSAAKQDDPAAGYVDAHSHIWTPDTQKYPLAAGLSKADLDPASFTTEELLATARAEGVSRVVLIAHTRYYVWDNRYMTDAAAEHPGVFSIVGAVDHKQPDVAGRMKELARQRVRGFRIKPDGDPETWLDHPGMAQMWKCGADEGLAMCPLINPDALASVDRMCGKFPDTTVVIDHFARVGASGTIRNEDLDRLCALARHKRAHVKVSAFYALGKKEPPYLDLVPMIRRLLDAFGPERLMWASDCPYQLVGKHTYRDSIALVRDRLDFLSDGDRQWLLRKTATGVYFS